MNARYQDRRMDWNRSRAKPLTERNEEPRRPHPHAVRVARQHNRRRNQYTPIVERGWFLAFMGVVSVGLLVASSQGWLS